jgi:hypothetical protein
VDLQQQVLRLSAAGVQQQQLLLPLEPCLSLQAAEGVSDSSSSSGGGAMLQQQQQQEVRVCGDSVCAQVLAGQVMDANNSAQPSFANHIGTAANSNSSSDEGSSSSTGTDMPAGASPAAAPAGGDLSASAWLSAAVGVPCKLVRQVQYSRTAKAHAALHSHQQQQQQVHAVGDGHGSSSA